MKKKTIENPWFRYITSPSCNDAQLRKKIEKSFKQTTLDGNCRVDAFIFSNALISHPPTPSSHILGTKVFFAAKNFKPMI